ncbi:Os04g0110700 [Oryza sativa Japonica Group]|uniref:Os04g0110700 protein n=1 Tax=Oryza sativa subsp. japonica TaxID=39947 RepID=A0A0P0W5Y8_ORYSJ|nr:hypothetical protein DAI22_04g005250 [Oryza sativa Japonica Group]BAS87572.1 Os04g0110700 [Oryza sativa Japonica Group]
MWLLTSILCHCSLRARWYAFRVLFLGQMVRQDCWRLASSSHPIQPDRASEWPNSEWPNWRCVREEGEGRIGGG